MSILEVEHLRVEFATENGPVIAVKDVSFTLERGEILALVGESGCGKSVTAMSIPRLLGDSNMTMGGSIRLNGVDVASLSEKRMQEIRGKEISFVFQEPMTSLNPAYTVGKQVAETIRSHERVSRRAALARAAELLELVEIPDPHRRIKSFPHELSGGMRQRVMIAIAVACNPKVLIADEPTSALDVTIQAGVLDVLRRLRDMLGTSVILITHDLGVVADIADRVVIMYSGRSVEESPTEGIFSRPQHPYTVGLLGALPGRAIIQESGRRRLTEIPGLVPPPTSDPDECQFAVRCHRATSMCIEKRPIFTEIEPKHIVACYHPGTGDRQ